MLKIVHPFSEGKLVKTRMLLLKTLVTISLSEDVYSHLNYYSNAQGLKGYVGIQMRNERILFHIKRNKPTWSLAHDLFLPKC